MQRKCALIDFCLLFLLLVFMAKRNAPRRGSLAFRLRKRAEKAFGRIGCWSKNCLGLAGFAGYKVGMARVVMVEDSQSPLRGQEVFAPVTLIETPPLFIYSVLFYKNTPEGLKLFCEIPCTNAPKEASSVITKAKKAKKSFEEVEKQLPEIAEIRVKVLTQPKLAGIPKKKPEVFEIGVGGTPAEAFAYAKEHLGKEVRVSEVFKEGERLDVIAVTKGKGWEGVVKRFGVALNTIKASKSRRHGGSIGPEKQAKVMYTVPRPGQHGFHRRTELNKRIMKISSKPEEGNKKSGFSGYGLIKNDFIFLDGSVPGPAKRLITLRKSLRHEEVVKPEIREVLL